MSDLASDRPTNLIDQWLRAHPRRPASAFRGVGMFTVERPEDTAGLRLDWRLTATDSITWVADESFGVVYQAETPSELAVALDAAAHATRKAERALVTNLYMDSWPNGWTCMPECYANADPPGEGRTVPNMLFRAQQVIGDAWGKVPVVPIVGCYDASGERPGIGRRLLLTDYLPDLEAAMREHACVVGYGVWRIETMASEDFAALR